MHLVDPTGASASGLLGTALAALTSVYDIIVEHFVAEATIVAAFAAKEHIASVWFTSWHFFVAHLTRRRYVLLWNDVDKDISHRLAAKLASALPRMRVRPESARRLLTYPRSPRVVSAVVLIDTDVSKLSGDDEVRNKIEDHLIGYLEQGGGIVGTHDIVYRRTRNDRLSKAFGDGHIDNFERTRTVRYQTVAEHAMHPLTTGLQREFDLSDGELLRSHWNDSGVQISVPDGRQPAPRRRPLVLQRSNGLVAQRRHAGRCRRKSERAEEYRHARALVREARREFGPLVQSGSPFPIAAGDAFFRHDDRRSQGPVHIVSRKHHRRF